jgi:hypothetical protein
MLNQPSHDAVAVASLPLQWFGAEHAPHDRIVLFVRACAVRNQAIAALGKRRHRIAKECSDLTSVLTASRNGLGIPPLPRIGPTPDGLRRSPLSQRFPMSRCIWRPVTHQHPGESDVRSRRA